MIPPRLGNDLCSCGLSSAAAIGGGDGGKVGGEWRVFVCGVRLDFEEEIRCEGNGSGVGLRIGRLDFVDRNNDCQGRDRIRPVENFAWILNICAK